MRISLVLRQKQRGFCDAPPAPRTRCCANTRSDSLRIIEGVCNPDEARRCVLARTRSGDLGRRQSSLRPSRGRRCSRARCKAGSSDRNDVIRQGIRTAVESALTARRHHFVQDPQAPRYLVSYHIGRAFSPTTWLHRVESRAVGAAAFPVTAGGMYAAPDLTRALPSLSS
jgi:hypothetical protein